MNSKSLVKLIEKARRKSPEVQSEPEFLFDQNRWLKAVRSWVREFQKDAPSESLPSFDRLFQATNQRRG